MLTVDFWLANVSGAENIIAGLGEINRLNQKIREQSAGIVYDLAQYPLEISKEKLGILLDEHSFMEQPRYMGKKLLNNEYYCKLQQEMNLNRVTKNINIQYGFTVRRTDLRILPTSDFVTNRPDDHEFDRLQQTAVTAAQPLIILHVSCSGQWYFVQSYFATGWIKGEHIGITQNRQEWLTYLAAKKFLIVTGNRLRLGFNPYSPELSELEFYMGDKLPLVPIGVAHCVDRQSVVGNYVVKLPIRRPSGQLGFKLALVPIVSDVYYGYLPYTRGNILRQAFKMQGDRYGWGGSFNSRDCSSFLLDIYRSFGVQLPRNTWEQMNTAGQRIDFADKTDQERRELLTNLEPGAALYFQGHVMLYIGEYHGDYYVLHGIAECADTISCSVGVTLRSTPLHNIMVTPLSLVRLNGQSLFAALTVGKLFQ